MDLREAYRMLEVPVGASEDAVRDARKVLAKVWHPDRHAGDPELQKRAQQKLAGVNAAFELIAAAKFPSTLPDPPKPKPKLPDPPPPKPDIELVPRRRVRWSVIFVLALALGAGAYFAIVRLGGEKPAPRADATVVAVTADASAPPPPVDAPVAMVADATEPVADASEPVADASEPDASEPVVETAGTFTLGSTRDHVVAAQGQPTSDSRTFSIINGVRSAREEMRWGPFSSVELVDDRVAGWWSRDIALHVHVAPVDRDVAAAAKARGTLAKGSSRDEVIGLLGTPSQVDRKRWSWSFSWIEFDSANRVESWYEADTKLRIR